ncbi:MAG: hypothetical protein WDN67_01700 [Candidatus Moraniibacteriota bacterium]
MRSPESRKENPRKKKRQACEDAELLQKAVLEDGSKEVFFFCFGLAGRSGAALATIGFCFEQKKTGVFPPWKVTRFYSF